MYTYTYAFTYSYIYIFKHVCGYVCTTNFCEASWDQCCRGEGRERRFSRRAECHRCENLKACLNAQPTRPFTECSYPFKMEAHGCFWLHKNPGLPWEAARRRCQQSGSDLATPSSLAQMREFLLREIGRGEPCSGLGFTLMPNSPSDTNMRN